MDGNIRIRNEEASDREAVERIAREAFYNLYIPGCVEHYLIRIMREHEDFIPQLDFVIELGDAIIGNIMYTKAVLTDEEGREKEILTFGPLCILPAYQRQGHGKRLIEHSFAEAARLGYDTVVIFGSPVNYVSRGFRSCRKHRVHAEDGRFPAAMMVKELVPGVLAGHEWFYHESEVMKVRLEDAEAYDAGLPPMEKKHLPSQEEFYIMSNSFLDDDADRGAWQ